VSNSYPIARVVLDTRLPQLDRLFDYAIEPGVELTPGVRVKVPLRSNARFAPGYVHSVVDNSEHKGKLAPLAEVVSQAQVMPERLYELCDEVARRCAGSTSDVLRLAIPPRYVRVEKAWLSREESPVPAGGEADPTASLEVPTWEGYAGKSAEDMLAPGTRWSLSTPYGVVEVPQGATVPRSTMPIVSLAATALSRGQSTIIVVPDWRDLESFQKALESALAPDGLAFLHTQQPPAQRYQNYLRTLQPQPVVVLGSRHAIYAPVSNLAAIVVVEDGDEAHREPLAPYPHTRDIATIRAGHDNAALIFASMTPSYAVRRWIDMGYVAPVGPTSSSRAKVVPTALTTSHDSFSSPARLPSLAVLGAKEALTRGPVLIQVFRAGYSSGLACEACGERGMCRECHGPLRLPRQGSSPSCAWCGVTVSAWSCQECRGSRLVPRGQGIGRTVADFGKTFPGVTIIRSDGEHPVASVRAQPALVVATRGSEPIAHRGYSAALLLDGPAMLSRESLGTLEDTLRAWERAVALVNSDGVVYLTDVEGPPALAMSAGNHDQLVRLELTERESIRLPPAVRIASLSGPASDVAPIVAGVIGSCAGVSALGPVPLGGGVVRTILRFSYAQGAEVARELKAWRNKLASGPRKTAGERVKIVLDNPHSLDALTSE